MKRILLVMACCVLAVQYADVNAQISDAMRKLNTAVFAVRELYVDSINEEEMVVDMINDMLQKLDPHSTYTSAEETREMNEALDGNFSGIGIQFNISEDTLVVVQIIAGGPSERVGMQAGDRIVAIDDTIVAGVGLTTADVRKKLRGPEGTTVDVKVLRRGAKRPIDFRIVREPIPIHSVDAAYMADEKTGYIRVSRFAMTTHDELVEAMMKLKKQGMQQLILDLQDNTGGYLVSAVYMANEFLNKGQLIVYTQGDKSPRNEAVAEAQGSFSKNKLVVLVDEGSASSSEIVAGALQDWDRAVIVGRRTFGKGLVQRPIPFSDGSMIRLTTSRYYTPAGRCIQKPYDKGSDEYARDIVERYTHGELMHIDSIHFVDSLQYKTLVTGRTIYGGGGIMPDVFVPLDTTLYSDYHRDIVAKGTLSRFAMEYLDKNRKRLERKYPDIETFNRDFVVTDDMMAQLKKEGDKDEVEYNAEQAAHSHDIIARQLKALIARDLFDMTAYFIVMNPVDPLYLKGLEIINDDKRYYELLGR